MDIQWFPGHMAKTRRMIADNIKMCDCVVELCDARLPQSSRNPELPRLTNGKKTLLVINKSDLADPVKTQQHLERFKKEGQNAVSVSCNDAKGVSKITESIRFLLKDKIEHDRARGFLNRPIRIMICGIPNVGKSSFINKLALRSAAKASDKPGVTRGKQWVTLKNGMELLDTPGILWPKFEDKNAALLLAYTGAIKDDILDTQMLCARLLEFLKEAYPGALMSRYKLDSLESENGYELLEKICRKRGFIQKGNEVDLLRGASVVLDEFRGGKLGRITLE